MARLEVGGVAPWEQNARRLVDAQAPGLAARVRKLGEQVSSGRDSAAQLLEGLGTLALLTRAYRRLDQLEAALQHDVRQLVGINLDKEDVERLGQRLSDRWLVVAQTQELAGRCKRHIARSTVLRAAFTRPSPLRKHSCFLGPRTANPTPNYRTPHR